MLEKSIFTFAALGIIYFIFEILPRRVSPQENQSINHKILPKKALSILSLASYSVALMVIWIAETAYILLSLGLIGAAIAFALQDIFKNFAGGIMIFLNGIYHVGERIEFNQKFGDVIDVGILYTTLLETREWV